MTRQHQYEAEAEEKWGGTPEYAESIRRTRAYGQAEWAAIQTEAAEVYGALARLKAAGVPADSAEGMDAAERHRAHISRWFYPCSPEVHRALGRGYVEDARFTATVDAFGAGVSAYARDAFAANADRQTGKG